jgi:hypothetical protein
MDRLAHGGVFLSESGGQGAGEAAVAALALRHEIGHRIWTFHAKNAKKVI